MKPGGASEKQTQRKVQPRQLGTSAPRVGPPSRDTQFTVQEDTAAVSSGTETKGTKVGDAEEEVKPAFKKRGRDFLGNIV